MRDFKFRMWDTEFKRMKVTGVGVNNGVLYGEDVVIMQYTGLKDKNGKEIYEGDILDVGDNRWLREVVWFGTGWAMRCIRSDKGPRYTYAYIVHADQWDGNIVGNIYENPELIQK